MNCRLKVVFAALLRLPAIIVPDAVLTADARTGSFCKRFGPECGPRGVFGVTPSSPRSMPIE
jgi:hypothetical protein